MIYIDVDADPTTFNSSRAALNLPAGSEVLFAGLYWGGDLSAGTNGRAAPSPTSNRNIKFQVPGSLTYIDLGPSQPAGNPYRCSLLGSSASGASTNYAAFCDVTALVKTAGNGGYTVANVQAGTGENRYAGWTMAIAYKYAGEPSRNLTIFQGYAIVSNNNSVTIPVTGFRAPPAGNVNAKIGAIAFEGDLGLVGDSMKLNGQTLSDALSSATNFFNSSFDLLGSYYTARTPNYSNLMAVDAKLLNTTNIIGNNDTSATIVTSTNGDTYFPVVMTSAIEIYAPKINAVKTATDINGGSLAPGDVVQYDIAVSNTGQDSATNLVLTDAIPANTMFVPGSLKINGSSAGALASYNGTQVVFNLGSGASPAQGGTLAVNATTSVSFQVQVNASAADETVVSNVAGLAFNASITGTALNANSNQVNLTVARPILVLEKTASPNPVKVGATLVYTLNYRNDGTAPAVNAQIVDTLPAGVTHVSNSLGVNASGQTLTLPLGTVPRGASGSINIVVQVNSAVANGTALVNQAVFSADGEVPVAASQTTTAVSQPFLTLNKTASSSVVGAGRQIVYTLTFTNAGTSDALNVQLSDPLPAGLQFSSATGGGSFAGGTVNWSLGAIAAGGSGSVSFVATVNAAASAGTVITNNATISGSNTNTATASATTTVVAQAVLNLTKVPSVTRIPPGSLLTYTMSFTNTGTDVAQNVVLYDPLLPHQTYVSSTGNGQYDATTNTVTWPIGTLAVQQSGSVTATVRIDSGLQDGLFIRNKATLTSTSIPSVDSSTQIVVFTQPQLTIQKTVSKDTVSPGDTLVYTLNYANTGSGDAVNAFIIDTLPEHEQFVSASAGGTLSGNEVRWALGNITAGTSGSVTLTTQVATPLANGTQLINSVTINTPDPVVQPATATVISKVSSAPQLVVKKTSQNTVVDAGKQQTYTINYSNMGNDTATAVTLVDTLSASVDYVSSAPAGTYDPAAHAVTWSVPDLSPGDSGSVTVTVTFHDGLTDGQMINNIVTLNASNVPPVEASATTEVNAQPKLSISKVADKTTAQAGGLLKYTLAIHNEGNASASGVSLLDDLPGILTAAPTAISGGGVYDAVKQQVNWTIGMLGVGESQSFDVTVQVPSPLPNGTLIDNAASVSSNEQPVQTTHIAVPAASAPQLSISKTADKNPVLANDTLTYTIQYANNGSDAAVNAVLEESVPLHTTLLSASGTYTQSGNVLTWNLGNLSAGAAGSVTVTVTVANGLANGTLIDNTATINADNAQPAATTLQTVVSSSPRLSIDKSTDPAGQTTINAGVSVSYLIHGANTGTTDALNAVVTDIVPKGMTYVSAVPSPSSVTTLVNGTTEIVWNIGMLAFGGSTDISIVLQADSPIDNSAALNNQANIVADNAQPVSSSVSLIAQSHPVLTLSKSASQSNPFVLTGSSNTLVYTLSYGNTGSDDADNVFLVDTLPANVTFLGAGSGGAYDPVAHQVTWSLGSVAAGGAGSVTVSVNVPAPMLDGTELVNNAVIRAVDSNSSALLSEAIAANSITVSTAPAMSIVKQVQRPVISAGNQNTFLITVSNDASATDAIRQWTITDVLDPRLLFVSASGGVYDAATRTLTWPGNSITPGSSTTVSVTVQSPSPVANSTVISNTATAQASNAAPQTGQASFSIDSTPVLGLTKTVSKNPVAPNDAISYTLTYSNTGTADAANVVLTDLLPSQVTFNSAVPVPSSQAGQLLTWNLGTVAAGASASIVVNVTVNTGLTDGEVLNNQATITDGSLIEQAQISTVFDSNPVLALQKLMDVSSLLANGDITYNIVYSNNGNDVLKNTVVTDPLPADVTFVSASASGVYDPGTHTISWPIGDLAIGSSGQVSVRVQVKSTLLAGSLLTNNAMVYAANASPAHASLAIKTLGGTSPSGTITPIPVLEWRGQVLLILLLLAPVAYTIKQKRRHSNA